MRKNELSILSVFHATPRCTKNIRFAAHVPERRPSPRPVTPVSYATSLPASMAQYWHGAGEPDGRRGRATGHSLQLDKVLYPGNRFTKAQVIDYYVRVAPWLLPHYARHPVT